MRIAALCSPSPEGAHAVHAFEARAIPVDTYTGADALLLAWPRLGFDAILVQDHATLLKPWLAALQAQLASRTPIVVIGRGDAQSIAQALMWGADDYATEAEGAEGLFRRVLARVRAGAVPPPAAPLLRVGVYSLYPARRTLASPAHQAELTVRECKLAQILFEQPGRLATAEALRAALFEDTDARSDRSIERQVYTLRKKCVRVSRDQATALCIESVYGAGYRLTG